MAYRANKSFTGLKLTMHKGEVRDIADESLVSDLLRCGYITDLEEKQKALKEAKAEKAEKAPAKATRKRGGSNA